MALISCRACGLRNPLDRERCQRCGEALAGPGGRGEAWREGDLLVAAKDASLPDRCVRCDAPSGRSRLKQQYHWHSPALYLIAPFALLIYAIIALAVRKSARVELGICSGHASRRRRAIVGGWILAVLGIATPFIALAADRGELALLGLVLLLGGAIWGSLEAAPLKVKNIDDRFVRLKGADPRYLQRLPQWGGLL